MSCTKTHHVCDVQNLSGHSVFVVAGCRRKPQFLKCLIHQFLCEKQTNQVLLMCVKKQKQRETLGNNE